MMPRKRKNGKKYAGKPLSRKIKNVKGKKIEKGKYKSGKKYACLVSPFPSQKTQKKKTENTTSV